VHTPVIQITGENQGVKEGLSEGVDLNDNGEKKVLHEQKDDEEIEDDINNKLDSQL
jgi:hypothetical protein